MQNTLKHDIGFLDFLRGWSALLVFFHHASILGGGPNFLAGNIGQEAVNIFMLASGFLIYYQCSISKAYSYLETKEGIKTFYIRRFFRIAPLYYLVLVISYFLSSHLGVCRQAIAVQLPNTVTNLDRYFIANPVQSFIYHVTFAFGFIPSYSFSTPLPDWSLGLEMQFYFIFPILFFFLRKRFLSALLLSTVCMFLIWYLSSLSSLHYPMPSFLPLKFHNFSAGIALAYLFLNKQKKSRTINLILISTSVLLLIGNKNFLLSLVFIASWWLICEAPAKENKVLGYLQKLFSSNSSKFLAEISYSVYISHLLFMLPFFAYILKEGKLSFAIWLIASLALLTFIMGVSFLLYKYIETPGINFGKKLIRRSNTNKAV